MTYFVLKHSEFGVANLLLLVLVLAVYAVFARDFGYLRAVVEGATEYWKHGRTTASRPSPDGGERRD